MPPSTSATRSEEFESGGPTRPAPVRRRPAVQGLAGGVVATAVMTAYRLPAFRALPPTAEFWAAYVGEGDPEEHVAVGMVLHVLYGAGGGGLFGLAFDRLDFGTGTRRRWAGVVLGVAYGLLLAVVGTRVVFRRVLNERLDDDEAFVFVVGHAVYGIALGTWMVTRREFGDAYD